MWTARSGLVDFLAGGVGGAGMVMMSHPSDTVKLLLQVCMAGCMSGLCACGRWGGGGGGGEEALWTRDTRLEDHLELGGPAASLPNAPHSIFGVPSIQPWVVVGDSNLVVLGGWQWEGGCGLWVPQVPGCLGGRLTCAVFFLPHGVALP